MSGIESYNVLFLCTGNSARSILAEAYLNSLRGRPFKAYSAGSHPAGAVNSHALDVLRTANIPVEGLRSKSWDEFAIPGAPKMHFVFTVCDNAAGEVCPIWPGQPMTAHWPFQDPAAFEGSEVETHAVFLDVFRQIRTRIDIFTNLPLRSLDKLSLQKKLTDLGRNVVEAE
ncbi:arsenate reductase ArsC [Parvibaculum sp.]|uniref:arsenate reductase ArsC n=1 Tax=Parvibaculum sp. TaxID=2024848 RepID=UPI0027176916|nr:arsenate reductase ArsC [Parvibaculum sp.]MDO9127754.1 arsenate reductase ArsC [Parvibaculum sp.]MDP1627370.1 arsenate reductase ArsC [Parvibaculum sp.]MDP2149449.1 arsenate reductase ArsC [Parvibaculum sp.]MDP3328096.1 arsenate reductase ArsC [Parvibaculum sp.]